jgi:hypothetical protein
MATVMPFGRAYGKMAGFVFAFSSMIMLDCLVGKVGIWTFATALAYGLVGAGAVLYFKNKENTAWNYASNTIYPLEHILSPSLQNHGLDWLPIHRALDLFER